MRINTNEAANTSQRLYGINNKTLAKNVEKLSSGLRVNSAADDAAGLAISEKMRSQYRGLDMASKNTQDGISLIQTAEGALQSTHDMLQRMRELAVQSANGVYDDTNQRASMQKEFEALKAEITKVAERTDFNGVQPLKADKNVIIQSGPNNSAENQTTIALKKFDWSVIMSDNTAAAVDTVTNARTAIASLDKGIANVSTMRAELGAQQNALEFTIKNLDISSENLKAAEGRIRNVDMAKEITDFAKNNILLQASTAMLAQANLMPEGVIRLLT
jgi:flagellin